MIPTAYNIDSEWSRHKKSTYAADPNGLHLLFAICYLSFVMRFADQSTPVPMRRYLPNRSVATAFELGWSELSNGELLAAAETQFDVLVTTDRHLDQQPNLEPKNRDPRAALLQNKSRRAVIVPVDRAGTRHQSPITNHRSPLTADSPPPAANHKLRPAMKTSICCPTKSRTSLESTR
jgi:hypothetical protein